MFNVTASGFRDYLMLAEVRIGMNREFVGDWKGSSCGIFQSTVAMCPENLRENLTLVRYLPEIARFLVYAEVCYGST